MTLDPEGSKIKRASNRVSSALKIVNDHYAILILEHKNFDSI